MQRQHEQPSKRSLINQHSQVLPLVRTPLPNCVQNDQFKYHDLITFSNVICLLKDGCERLCTRFNKNKREQHKNKPKSLTRTCIPTFLKGFHNLQPIKFGDKHPHIFLPQQKAGESRGLLCHHGNLHKRWQWQFCFQHSDQMMLPHLSESTQVEHIPNINGLQTAYITRPMGGGSFTATSIHALVQMSYSNQSVCFYFSR